jgi:hypothetical protein
MWFIEQVIFWRGYLWNSSCICGLSGLYLSVTTEHSTENLKETRLILVQIWIRHHQIQVGKVIFGLTL